MALWQVGTKLPQLNHLSRTWGWRCCLSVVVTLSVSLSVHLWRNLLASCNKPLHMRRLAGYTHTHTLKLGLELATGGGSDQLQFRVQCACHKKICGSFFVFLINKIIKAITTTTRETNFVCCVGKLRCHPVADTIQDQVWVLTTNYAHATNWPPHVPRILLKQEWQRQRVKPRTKWLQKLVNY